MLLAPSVDLSADSEVGDEHPVLQRLVVEGGGVVLLQPFLNVNAVVRVAVGGDDGVVHQSALERHVLQLICNKKREHSAAAGATGAPGASERATQGEFVDVMAAVCFAKGKQLLKLMNDRFSSSFMLRDAQRAAVVAIRPHVADLSNWHLPHCHKRSHVLHVAVILGGCLSFEPKLGSDEGW